MTPADKLDRVRTMLDDDGVWTPCTASVGGTVEVWHDLEFRCRRKDLPVMPVKAPVTKPPSSIDINVDKPKTRTVTLREWAIPVGQSTQKYWGASCFLIASDCTWTGRTCECEVPE